VLLCAGRGGVGDLSTAWGAYVMGPANVSAGIGAGHGGYGGGSDHDNLNSGMYLGSNCNNANSGFYVLTTKTSIYF